jgi:hypothetical protein
MSLVRNREYLYITPKFTSDFRVYAYFRFSLKISVEWFRQYASHYFCSPCGAYFNFASLRAEMGETLVCLALSNQRNKNFMIKPWMVFGVHEYEFRLQLKIGFKKILECYSG